MAKDSARRNYDDVPGDPVKSFFVEMLTRDIELEDAILDLLDNCVDGILRAKKRRSKVLPYKGFWAHITFNKDSFEISDNCGGIPWNLHEYAFRMGRADPDRDKNVPTVGFYGIGMKRAIFKIGLDTVIQTQNGSDAYDVNISPDWIRDEERWTIPVSASKSRMGHDGTIVLIGELRSDVRAQFGDSNKAFESSLRNKVATHFAFIIALGLEVKINGKEVVPRATELRFEGKNRSQPIRPYIYEAEIDGVSVFLAVGFTRPIPSLSDIEDEATNQRYSSDMAGWTVLCNDRAVLYANRDELTGWGEATVPKYHTQFISIAGIVEFRSNDPSKLPTNTTKRGIDAGSRIYLQVKNKMREGMKLFTDFTNQWKGDELAQQAKDRIKNAPAKNLAEIKIEAKKLSMTTVRAGGKGKQYKPKLPKPSRVERRRRRIVFSKPLEEVEAVSVYFFDDPDVSPSKVGEECFDECLREAKS